MQSKNQSITLPILSAKNITLHIKREDLLHPFISGNKYRKLKYNLLAAATAGHKTIVTFGGAFSNHIAATAYAASEKGFKSIGVIRGEELSQKWQENSTLKKAYDDGMRFKFVPRSAYKEKNSKAFIAALKKEFGDFYLVPEGGTNALAIKGCEEIVSATDQKFDIITTCVGTGGTVAGIINTSALHQKVIGFSALKGDFLSADIKKITRNNRWELNADYHFGGYGKITEELVYFINNFKDQTGVPLDPIYTGKMLFGLLNMVKRDIFAPGTSILAVHTGGLQGLVGMNSVLKKKNLPLLNI